MGAHQTLRCLSMRKKDDDFQNYHHRVCITSISIQCPPSPVRLTSAASSPTSFPSIHRISYTHRMSVLFVCELVIWFRFAIDLLQAYERAVITHFIASFAYKSIMTLTKENSFKLKFLQSHTHSSQSHSRSHGTRACKQIVALFHSFNHIHAAKSTYAKFQMHIHFVNFVCRNIDVLFLSCARLFSLDKTKRKKPKKVISSRSTISSAVLPPFLRLVVSDSETVQRDILFLNLLFSITPFRCRCYKLTGKK